jgi:Tfp pilus assembly protein PilF
MKRFRQFSWLILAAVLAGAGCSREARYRKHVARADQFFEQDDLEHARIEYLNAVRINAGVFHPVYRLGVIYQDQGATLSAGPFLYRASELGPGEAGVRGRLALFYQSIGDLDHAREEAIAALERDPRQEEAILLLADWRGKEEQLQEVQQALTMARQKGGAHALYHIADAVMALRKKDPAAAEAAVQRAKTLDAESAAVHSVAGTIELTRSNLTGAEAEFRRAAELSPLRSSR